MHAFEKLTNCEFFALTKKQIFMKTGTQYRIVSTITKEALQMEISGTFVDAHFCSVCSFLQKHRQNLQKRGYVCGNAQQKKIGWNAIKSNNHFTLS